MNVEEFHAYCIAKPGTEETFPFDEHTLVFKVMGKVYAITGLNHEEFRVNLKCDPEYGHELREEYPGQIIPAWHMSKVHWNTVYFENSLSDKLLCSLIDHSYDLVVAGLPTKKRTLLEDLSND